MPRNSNTMFNRREERLMEDNFTNTSEAFALLDLINAEFVSDPQSVQCFDLRIVERVALCVARRKLFDKRSIFGCGR